MKKLLVLFAVFTLLCNMLYSQETEEYGYSDELGINAGFTTGLGLSYRLWSPDGLGFQLTALPVKTDYVQIISVGATMLKGFYNGRLIRSFAYFGNHVLWEGLSYTDKIKYNAGLGFGLELGKYPKFNIMVGYAAYDITNEVWFIPTVEAGFYFDLNKKK